MRASALSDDKVIATVNEFLVPLEINVTTDGLPTDKMPAMRLVESIYKANWRTEFGFASCLVLDPEGKIALGSSTIQPFDPNDPAGLFSPQAYLAFIVKSLERWQKVKSIRQLPWWQQLGGWKDIMVDISTDMRKNIQSQVAFHAGIQP